MLTLDEFKKELKKYGMTVYKNLNKNISFYYNDIFLVSLPLEVCLAEPDNAIETLKYLLDENAAQDSPLSDEEIKTRSATIKRLLKSAPLTKCLASTPLASCSHTFKPYIGLSETFEFCTKCDERKGNGQ